MIYLLRRLALWAFDRIPLGSLAPHVLGFTLGSRAQRIPVLVLEVRSCTDRGTRGLEHLLPKLAAEGRCNSSHGGSCCACGGPLPDEHEHLNARCRNCPSDNGHHDSGFGGNVCSAACRNRFVGWLEDAPPRLSICLGHGRPPEVFGSWSRHQRHSVEVRMVWPVPIGHDPSHQSCDCEIEGA
ncbi:hypothetical protein LCGC14_1262700 [marine sediment metagenome]|uniref:Uncharacterized protein n=1 Tax=marine sediment metagenome TaxID=412755 RepID=A0A0F9P3K5_9ZZZZ